MISAMHKFWENTLESLQSISETTPWIMTDCDDHDVKSLVIIRSSWCYDDDDIDLEKLKSS